MSPADLTKALAPLPLEKHPQLLVGTETADDAGVYKIADDVALVQTLDLITPIVDDPFLFGQIAAANSLSDIYAMGGRPLTAMNIICFRVFLWTFLSLQKFFKEAWRKFMRLEPSSWADIP